MAAIEPSAPVTAIDAATRVGIVSLTVAKLERSIRFYTEAIGLRVLRRAGSEAVLGTADAPLLALREQPGALPWMIDRMTGLYHLAILTPTRADLGRWVAHYLDTEYPPPGQGDHIVSEALYLRDPDGHGIEVYADRPREGWEWNGGQVRMGGGPVDVRGLMAEGRASGTPWSGMPSGTILGHVHLQVGDISRAEEFYHEILGFDITARMPTALFVSAGGYHHHLGLNTWHSEGAAPASPDTATLQHFTFALPSTEALAAVEARIRRAGLLFEQKANALLVRDPWQNLVVLHVGPLGSDVEAIVG